MKMKTQLTLAAVVAAGLLASGCSQQMVGQQAVADQGVVTPTPPTPPKTIVKTIVDCSKCKRPAQPPRGGNMHTHPAIPGCTNSIKHSHPHPKGGRHTHKYGCKKKVRPTPRPARPMRPAVRPAVRPRPAPVTRRPAQSGHVHPAIPGCTNSIRHNHPNGNRPHRHRYSCRRPQVRPQVRPPVRPPVRPQRPQIQPPRRPSGHVHPAIPGCTNSIRHNHPNGNRPHRHHYVCRGAQRPQVRPPVRPQRPQIQPPRPYVPVPVMPKVKAKGTYKGAIQIDGVMQQYQQ